MTKGRAAAWKLTAFVLAFVAIVWALRHSPVVALATDAQNRVADWGVWGAVCYPLLFALCNLLLLPGGILSVGSGFLFGLWWGFFLVLVGNTIAAALAFLISRSIGQQWLSRALKRHRVLRNIEPAVEREGWKIILLSQLHPLFPTSLLNYFYGLTNIRFRTFLAFATLGRIPGIFLYVYLGTLGQFGIKIARGSSHPRIFEYWIWGGAFLLTAFLLLILSRIAVQAVAQANRSST